MSPPRRSSPRLRRRLRPHSAARGSGLRAARGGQQARCPQSPEEGSGGGEVGSSFARLRLLLRGSSLESEPRVLSPFPLLLAGTVALPQLRGAFPGLWRLSAALALPLSGGHLSFLASRGVRGPRLARRTRAVTPWHPSPRLLVLGSSVGDMSSSPP